MKFYISIAALILNYCLYAQEAKKYTIRTVAFYNLENLFDVENDSLTYDDDRTPDGKDNWTQQRYNHKLAQMARVIADIGATTRKAAPDIIGVCEVENEQVVNDLVKKTSLAVNNYGIVHFDSPDERGIDVALLYKKEAFIPTSFNSHRLLLNNADGYRDYTRDQLIVTGLLDGEKISFIVNHWPSRSGGEVRSRPFRIEAAKLNKRIIDSVRRYDIDAKIISMGDFNDDPIDPSFKKILKVRGKPKQLDSISLYGPMEKLFRKGQGSLAYRDKWNLFDQFYMTSNLIATSSEGYSFWKTGIFKPSYLIDPKGRYKGYPLRTYAGGSYIGGYSDHFPVYLYLIKRVDW